MKDFFLGAACVIVAIWGFSSFLRSIKNGSLPVRDYDLDTINKMRLALGRPALTDDRARALVDQRRRQDLQDGIDIDALDVTAFLTGVTPYPPVGERTVH